MSEFLNQVRKFNIMYGLGVPKTPAMLDGSREATIQRLVRFKEILQAELNEVEGVITALRDDAGSDVYALGELADWLADMQVYCASEATRFGLDNDIILRIVMESNFSKLGADGLPIVENGKVVKGPNYWKPEPLLRSYVAHAQRHTHGVFQFNIMGNPHPKEELATDRGKTSVAQAVGQAVNSYQVGGNHYLPPVGMPQHWDLAIGYQWDPFQYQITKYVMRWKDKHDTHEGKLRDLQKAAHFLEKYISVHERYLPPVQAQKDSLFPTALAAATQAAGQNSAFFDPQGHNEWWTNEGYYGDGTCLYKCRRCKSTVRKELPGGAHGCMVGQAGSKAS